MKLFDYIGPYLRHEKRINDMNIVKENIKVRNELYGVRK